MEEAKDASNKHQFNLHPSHEKQLPIATCWQQLMTLRSKLLHQTWFQALRQMLILIIFFIIGCAVYTKYEGWSVGTAISFIINTITTVGYGYHYPTTDGTRLFTVFYMFFGIIFIFQFIRDIVTRNVRKYFDTLIDEFKTTDISSSYRLNYYLVWANILAIFLWLVFGALVFTDLEQWSFSEALYFTMQTSFTVGYGDMPLRHGWTHAFLGCYIFIAIFLVAFAFENMKTQQKQQVQLENLENLMRKQNHLNFLTDLDVGPGVTEEQFVLRLLLYFGTLNYEQDVKPWADKFKALDKCGQGRLFRADLLAFTDEERDDADQQIQQLETVRMSHRRFSFYQDVREMLGRDTFASSLWSSRNTLQPSASSVGLRPSGYKVEGRQPAPAAL